MAITDFERYPLTFGPSPVHRMDQLTRHLGGAQVWAKREDVYQSNHTRQVAAVAAHLGLKAVLVQEKWVDWDDPVNDQVGNILLSRVMGADVRLNAARFDIGIRQSC